MQNTRSIGLKIMFCAFLCKSPHWELRRKIPKQSSSEQGRNCSPASLRRGEERREILLPAALPGTDVAQQTPPCHGQYHRFVENSYSPTH